MAFKHKRHDDILKIIEGMNTQFLENNEIYFSGGTAIAMAFGEKRLSFDIDFLTNSEGFKAIRNLAMESGVASIFQTDDILVLNESRSSYSISAIIKAEYSDPIKLEFVNEGRIKLGSERGLISENIDLLTINKQTMIAQKFMAMCDRGLDVGFHCRDYWDLSVLSLNSSKEDIREGFDVACDAYGKKSVSSMVEKVSKLAQKNKKNDFDFLKVTESSSELEKGSRKLQSVLSLGNQI